MIILQKLKMLALAKSIFLVNITIKAQLFENEVISSETTECTNIKLGMFDHQSKTSVIGG